MVLFEALRQRFASFTSADSNEYIDNFFKHQVRDDFKNKLNEEESGINAFVHVQLQQETCRGIALVTSGATSVPLDMNQELFVDLTSRVQEYQGPACVEYLLSINYSVIFLYREDSLQPFTRHFQKYIYNGAFLDMFQYQTENGSIVLNGFSEEQTQRFRNIMKYYHASRGRIYKSSFTSIQQYLSLLRIATKAIDQASTRGIVILAATVMEFYVPVNAETQSWGKQNGCRANTVAQHLRRYSQGRMHLSGMQKNNTAQTEFSISFVQAPHLIRKICKDWCPKAFVVSFTYDLPHEAMVETAHRDLELYGVDVIVGTNRVEYPHQILLVTEQDDKIITCPENEDINDAFAAAIADLHRNFCKMRKIMQKSKQLLLLSAKFSMLKPRDLLNEDAAGNRNVKFGKGVQIRTQRSLGNKSPVYELKDIFQNKSHCARAHIWECRGQHNLGEENTDVVIAFSPAGTPNTIRDVWGDFWSGWAEEEILDLKRQLGSLSLTSALDVVTASISGDYSSAAALLRFMWSKIGSAWSDGEQTRVRQSIQNMISVGLVRGLVEVTNLTPLKNLTVKAQLRASDSIVMDNHRNLTHSRSKIREGGINLEDADISLAESVRVHKAVKGYMDDMIEEGIIEATMKYIAQGAFVHITGYSMGGMLGQLLMLCIGDRCRMQHYDVSRIDFVGFGSPRVGDSGFAARLRVLFEPEQLLNVMHPSDNIHAFPPTSEGYEDAVLKIFLREHGLGVGRRTPSSFSLLPMVREADRIIDRITKTSKLASNITCEICNRKGHSSEQHRCRYCTERGTHRGSACPNRTKPCRLCRRTNHCTGEHRCKVCQQYGHRGRECHAQRDVGVAELVTYFRYHNYLYYDTNIKQSVEFSAA